MKNKIYLVALIILLTPLQNLFGNIFLNTPCPEDEKVALVDLPSGVLEYIANNFPKLEIDAAERYSVEGAITYLIKLEDNVGNDGDAVVAFDVDGNFMGNHVKKDFAPNELPDLAINNLNTSFQGVAIEEVELELSWNGQLIYEVDLENNVEVLLDILGNMVCEKN